MLKSDHHRHLRFLEPDQCSHLLEFRSRNGANLFRSLHDCLIVKPLGRASIRREPNEVSHCSACNHAQLQQQRRRLYACVYCSDVSCHLHVSAHARKSADHVIAVDVDRAELFCCVCSDQVYDRDFDAAVVLAQTASATFPPPENLRKRRRLRRVEYRPWSLDSNESALVEKNSSLLTKSEDDSSSDLPLGLKGLNNLGNSCFLNSVLQALLHTPPLRNYFLSDKHNRNFCQQNRIKMNNGNSKRLKLCLACDLDAMYSAVFSGDRIPYSPAKFLYSWWQHAEDLACYEQQDAHEFFISMLDGIHEKVDKDRRRPQNQGNGDCCIAHRIFSGILRSDVICTACGFTSTTYDPCVDISLDLEPIQVNTSSKPTITNEPGPTTPTQTLIGCLDRFTKPERLGSAIDQKFFCQQCQIRQESLKQMSIRKLPLVSCFHIKRFEHSSIRNMSKKVDRYLQFPFSLDMAPYLSSSILRGRFGNRIFGFDGDETDGSLTGELSSEFELFAVITHTGKLDAGHYVTYLRLSDEWYKCDDAWITRVNEDIVRAAQGYMLFYVQKTFFYKVSEKPIAAS